MKRITFLVLVMIAGVPAMQAQAGDVFAGQRLYTQHCEVCHGNDGFPLLPGTPNLARGQVVLVPDQILLRSLRYGKGLMPGFESVLGRRELLDVLAYTRSLRR